MRSSSLAKAISLTNQNREDTLLEWASTDKSFKSFGEKKVNISENTYYQFQVQSYSEFLDQSFTCFGTSLSRKTAAVKAIIESLERRTAFETRRSNRTNWSGTISAQKGELEIKESENHNQIEFLSFYSTNGWAVHFDRKTAIENAFMEALERHILLLTYFKYGWQGFGEISRFSKGECDVTSVLSFLKIGGFQAGIALSGSNQFKGKTLGYLCDKSELILKSPRWGQAFFESNGALLRGLNSSQSSQQVSEDDLITRNYKYYLDYSFPKFEPYFSKLKINEVYPKIQANLFVEEISGRLNCPVPIYAAYVAGGDLIPLFFKEHVDSNSRPYLEDILSKYGVSSVPEMHPIL